MTIKMNRKKIDSVLDTRCSIPDRKSKACPSTGRLVVERSRGIVNRKSPRARPGVALLIVLFIVMAIMILSLGFVSRSDVEMSCGQNMLLRTQMDYLAESGLEHARGLILNPQDVTGAGYWMGGTNLQLTSGNDYYNVVVTRDADDLCNYIIDCNAYRLEGTERTGLSRLHAELRIDPCIAYWVGSSTTVLSATIIKGDVYCGGNLTNSGTINGDAFATGTINGTITGRKNESVSSAYPVAWPGLVSADFGPTLYYIGSKSYYVDVPADANSLAGTYGTSGTNRAGIWYCAGNANMPGGATINGTLVVTGDLTVSGANNVVTAEPNFPALLVGGQVLMKNGGSLQINGLAQIEQQITADPNTTNASISVTGGLFIANGGIISDKVNINISADPVMASIEIWPVPGTPKRWSPAAGAFFKGITRPHPPI
jgi:cytoskeletal protein CcmA (bactofilin family)